MVDPPMVVDGWAQEALPFRFIVEDKLQNTTLALHLDDEPLLGLTDTTARMRTVFGLVRLPVAERKRDLRALAYAQRHYDKPQEYAVRFESFWQWDEQAQVLEPAVDVDPKGIAILLEDRNAWLEALAQRKRPS